jgi:hypothetical protein
VPTEASGCRSTIRGDRQRGALADDVPVPTFGPCTVCTRGGIVGADARPNWPEQPARESLSGIQWR